MPRAIVDPSQCLLSTYCICIQLRENVARPPHCTLFWSRELNQFRGIGAHTPGHRHTHWALPLLAAPTLPPAMHTLQALGSPPCRPSQKTSLTSPLHSTPPTVVLPPDPLASPCHLVSASGPPPPRTLPGQHTEQQPRGHGVTRNIMAQLPVVCSAHPDPKPGTTPPHRKAKEGWIGRICHPAGSSHTLTVHSS